MTAVGNGEQTVVAAVGNGEQTVVAVPELLEEQRVSSSEQIQNKMQMHVRGMVLVEW